MKKYLEWYMKWLSIWMWILTILWITWVAYWAYVAMTDVNNGETLTASTFNIVQENIRTLKTTVDWHTSTLSWLSNIPAWAVMAFNLSSCPSGWIAANGSSGTPDLRGEFIRWLDGGRWVDAARTLASAQAQDWKWFYQTNTWMNWSAWYAHNDVYMWKSTSAYNWALFTWYWSNPSAAIWTKWDTSEVRPRNVALLYCVKQ